MARLKSTKPTKTESIRFLIKKETKKRFQDKLTKDGYSTMASKISEWIRNYLRESK